MSSSAADTVSQLVDAINMGDIDRAIALYEDHAVMVVQPGAVAAGKDGVREALRGFIALKPKLTTHRYDVTDAGDIALYSSDWTLSGTAPDGTPVSMGGRSSDILRRQKDGRWLCVIDNPWGGAVLG